MQRASYALPGDDGAGGGAGGGGDGGGDINTIITYLNECDIHLVLL